MNYELIQQADYTLSQCGGRRLTDGVVAIDFPGGLVYNSNNPPDQVTQGTITNPDDTTFFIRSISLSQDNNSYGRIQWPDGKYMSNQQLSLAQIAWYGPLKRPLTREMPIEPGELITVVANPVPAVGPGVTTNTSILFGGVFRYLLKGGSLMSIPRGDADRYARSPNGNILAPEMYLDTTFSEIPQGASRTPFILQSLSSQSQTIAAPGGNATIEIPVSSSFDFFARRLDFETSFDGGVAGELLVKLRDGSGYSLHSDYCPISQVEDAPLGKNWCVRAGVSIFADFMLRNATGVGNVNLTTVNVIGVRQKGA